MGVVLKINSIAYYVPLSSPKNKHKTMKNAKDFHKIGGGAYGVINFNKMIPVPSSCIIRFNFNDETDLMYRMLLFNQYAELTALYPTIKQKSENIYKLFHTDNNALTPNDIRVKERCCDFTLLESMYKDYLKNVNT